MAHIAVVTHEYDRFQIHQGQPVLLDANPTPGRPRSVRSMLVEAAANLADGFEGMMGRCVVPWRG